MKKRLELLTITSPKNMFPAVVETYQHRLLKTDATHNDEAEHQHSVEQPKNNNSE